MGTTKLLWAFVLCTFFSFVTSQACTVQNLQLTEEEPNLVATWTTAAAAGACEFEITVNSTADSQNGLVLRTTETSFVLTNAVACSEITIGVSWGGDLVSASTIISMRATTAPYLREMITSCNSIQMIWEAEPYEQNMCEVTHFQMFCLSDTHNFTIPQGVQDVQHRTFDILITVLQPDIYYTCNGFIFTTLAGFSPPSDSISFWSNLDSVRDLQVQETADSLKATWEAPLNSEECGVAYEVTYENEVLGSSSIEVVGLYHEFDIELISCTDYIITVKPISFTGSKGSAVDTEFTPSVRVGTVDDVAITDSGDALVLSWSPATVGQCPLVYIVNFTVNENARDNVITETTSLVVDRVLCADSQFSIEILSEGIVGDVVSVSTTLGSADINIITEVTNLNLDGNLLNWGAPSTVGYCDIDYIIDIENYFGETQTVSVETSINLDLVPCSNNVFTVRGTINNIFGDAASTSGVAPSAEFAPPSHVSTRPTFTTATVTLQGQSISENICVINTATLECSNDNADSFAAEIDVADNTPRLFSVVLEELEQDTIYTCVARLEDSVAGNEFAFRTVPLVEKDLIISDISEEGFLISWIEEYGSDFVIGYDLTVESLGPAHSLPDGCQIDTGVFTFSIPSDQASSYFVQGLPDYSYRVTLTTHYTLGLSLMSNAATARTLAGEPGYPDNLAVSLNVESTESFDVSAVLSWSSPCNLNGALRGFGVNVTANFMLGGLPQSVTVNLDVDAGEEDVNNVFSKTITDINPFFTYEVAVNVAAAVEGPSARIEFDAPSACVCGANDVLNL